MAVKPAHKLVKNDVVLVKNAAGATLTTRTVSLVRDMGHGVMVKFSSGASRLHRKGENVQL